MTKEKLNFRPYNKYFTMQLWTLFVTILKKCLFPAAESVHIWRNGPSYKKMSMLAETHLKNLFSAILRELNRNSWHYSFKRYIPYPCSSI